MKKLVKIFGIVFATTLAVYSVFKVVKLVRKYSLVPVLGGLSRLGASGADVIDISKNGTKFLSLADNEGLEAFKDYLDVNGYKFIGQFGNSNLYEVNGMEIIVKRTKLFGRYYLFEIYNERYFENSDNNAYA